MNKVKLLTSLGAISFIASGNLSGDPGEQPKNNHSSNHSSNHVSAKFAMENTITISRSGSFELDMTPDKALPLFTAPGEKLWVPGWEPVILNGDGFEKGTIFVTSQDDTTAYWNVLDYNEQTKHALYARVTPDSDTGTVDVTLTSNGKGGSTVSVSYQLTSLTEAGKKKLLNDFDEKSYAKMMQQWRALILDNMDKINAHL